MILNLSDNSYYFFLERFKLKKCAKKLLKKLNFRKLNKKQEFSHKQWKSLKILIQIIKQFNVHLVGIRNKKTKLLFVKKSYDIKLIIL